MEPQTQEHPEALKTIVANYDNKIKLVPVKFSFRTDKLGNKRQTVELKLPVPTIEGIIEMLESGGNELQLLEQAVQDVVINQARSVLNDNEEMTEKNFLYDQCTWTAIANQPEPERRGRGIPKEIWEAFAEDYKAIMPAITSKPAEAVELAAKFLATKFQAVKTNKPVIKLLRSQLDIYINATKNAEDFADCVKFLTEKADTLLAADEAELLDAL